MVCRLCQMSNLREFLDLGFSPPEDAFLSIEDLGRPEVWYPLRVNICSDCGFVQLSYVAPLKAKFGERYVYDTAATAAGVRYYQKFAKEVNVTFPLSPDDLVIDIGSNTGVLLKAFKDESNCKILGVDPAPIVARIANNNKIKTLVKPFDTDLADKIINKYDKAKLITGTNVFAHIDNLVDVVKAVDKLLTEDGLFIFENPHFLNLIKKMEYDTIYQGHCSYLSIKPLIPFFDRFGLEIFDVEENSIHGGSIRVFVGRKGKKKVSGNVKRILEAEEKARIHDLKFLKEWAQKVQEHRQSLVSLLRSLKAKGKRIVGVGAPAKSTTLLTYCQIGTQYLDYVTDVNVLKIGSFTPGLHIPIKSDEFLLEDMPEYALILPWNFGDEIMENLADYKKRGGKFIIPVPSPKIIE